MTPKVSRLNKQAKQTLLTMLGGLAMLVKNFCAQNGSTSRPLRFVGCVLSDDLGGYGTGTLDLRVGCLNGGSSHDASRCTRW